MIGDPGARTALAGAVVDALSAGVAGSASGLRGSLATGSADPYSDIDVFWEVPDARFEDALDALHAILSRVGPLARLRFDPLLQNSRKRRLAFAQFDGAPLFWRVDIEVSAASIGRDPFYDLENPDARGDDWSLTESALMNAVAALKYLLRGDDERAGEAIANAFDRVREPLPEAPVLDAVGELAEWVGFRDLECAGLVRQVQLLHAEVSEALAGDGAAR